MKTRSKLLSLLILCILATGLFASVPNQINFQGTLTDTGGNPITDTREMTFTIYTDSVSAIPLWIETQPAVHIVDGLFSVQLGLENPISPDIFDGTRLWLGITIRPDVIELSRRQPLITVPYGFKSVNADYATEADIAVHSTYADTASWSLGIGSISHADTADFAWEALHAVRADNATDAESAEHANCADTANFAWEALHATQTDNATNAESAEHAARADSAQFALQSETASFAQLSQNSNNANYANEAGMAEHAAHSDTAQFANLAATDEDWTFSGADVYRLAGNVGIGTSTPAVKLDVTGNINADSLYKIRGNTVLNVSGTENIMVGKGAGTNNVGGYGTFVGDSAGSNNQGWSNTFIGYKTGRLTSGNCNSFFGASAGYSNSTGIYDTFIGFGAGAPNTTGSYNTYVGAQIMPYNSIGSWNTFLGAEAGQQNTGSHNVFLGYQAGHYETGSNKLYIANGANDENVLICGDFSTRCVGLGTTNPDVPLQIGDGTHPPHFLNTVMQIDYNNDEQHMIEIKNNLGLVMWGTNSYGDAVFGSDTPGKNLYFQVGGAIRATIDGTSGNVGIGTQAPSRLLHVYSLSNPRILVQAPGDQAPELNLQRGTTTHSMYINANDDLVFYRAGDRVTFTDDGKVGIGTTAPSYKLDVEGDIECTWLHETSDDRLKTNINQLSNALDNITKIRGVSFEWNEKAESVGAIPGDKQIGVLASEVESVFPELVSTPDNGYKSVDYTKLTAVLIEAVKELRYQNETLRQTNENLEGRINALEMKNK